MCPPRDSPPSWPPRAPSGLPARWIRFGRNWPKLAKKLLQAGVTPDREVITYCQGGYRAAHSYLALRLLGYPRVRSYVGSWKEWGDRDDLPVEVPSRN